MRIRQLRKNEVRQFYGLAKRLIYSSPDYSKTAKKAEMLRYSPKTVLSDISSGRYVFLVAEERSRLVGFISAWFYAGVCMGEWVAVEPAYRGKSVATALFNQLIEVCKRRGCHRFWGFVRTSNRKANSLQKKLGFRKEALLKNYWYGEDYHVWAKSI